MPVQMRHDVAKRRQVDLVGFERSALYLLNQQHHPQQLGLLCRRKISHLNHVRGPDYARKARIQSITRINDSQVLVLPQDGATRRLA